MTYLVVGGNGFMGTHLVDRLLEGGHPVKVFNRSPNKFRHIPREAAGYVEGELGDHKLVREAVEGAEVVYHLASTTVPSTSNYDPAYDARSNLVDTIQLLEACMEFEVRRFVFASSVAVYGPPTALPIPEEHPMNPISSYGIAKLGVEKYLELFRHLYDLDHLTLRISNPYGPYQDPTGQQGVVSMFLHRFNTGRPLTVWGDGSALRDYLYVADLVDALVLAADVETRERVFNIGSGHGVSLNELLQVIAETVGEQPEVEYLPARASDIPASVVDTSRARAQLGWSPKTELADGVERTWGWIRAFPESKLKR